MQKNTFYSKKVNYHHQKNSKLKFHILSSDTGQRLDKWIKRKFPSIPQSLIEKFIRKKLITKNSKKVNSSERIEGGDIIQIPSVKIYIKKKPRIDNNELKKLRKTILKNIIFQDTNKIILNKPEGVAVHHGSKVNISIYDITKLLKSNFNEENPRIVHRIDKDTSGILILAKNYKTSVFLSEQFKKRNVKKIYIALLNGVPEKNKGEVCETTSNNKQKISVTKYFLIKKINQKLSLILLQPITGRKRQLREHCYKLGCPILGDKKFFKKFPSNTIETSNRLFLHAYTIFLPNIKGEIERFTAPIPDYMKNYLYNYKISCSNVFLNQYINKFL